MKPVAQIQTTGIYARRENDDTTAVVERNNILVVENINKLQEAIDEGNKNVILTAVVAVQIIKKVERSRNCAICCFMIALILAITFGVLFGTWKNNAENVQNSVFSLRDELQSGVFYTEYDKLKEICLSSDYSSCYDVGIYLGLSNPSYGDSIGVILSLVKDPEDNNICLTSDPYK